MTVGLNKVRFRLFMKSIIINLIKSHKRLLLLLAGGLLMLNGYGQYTGLRFSAHEVALNQRTGLNLTPEEPIKIPDEFTLSFDMKFEPGRVTYFGYIFRAIIDSKNYDLIHSPNQNISNNFHLVIGEKISNISFYYPLEKVQDDWITVELRMNGKRDSIHLVFDGKTYSDRVESFEGKRPLRLFFGAHLFKRFSSTDLPNMNIRSIKIGKKEKTVYHWPLDQSRGEIVKESIQGFHGKAMNPMWVAHLHTNWQKVQTLRFPGYVSTDYNPLKNNLIILREDSLTFHNISTGTLRSTELNYPFIPSRNSRIIYDTTREELYCYSIDLNKKLIVPSGKLQNQPVLRHDSLVTEHWHHNRMIDPGSQKLYTFGGYGQLKYSNEVLFYNDEQERWDSINYRGTFHPRYLAGMGYHPGNGNVYILGGFGSRTGQQAINPGYYYDLLSYSFDEKRFTQVATYNEQFGDFCFANSLYIDTALRIIYGLKFSKYKANPELQTIAISLDNPDEVWEVGNSFRFQFLDVFSNMTLYYNQTEDNLMAVTSFYDEGITEVNIHEIKYPPLPLTEEELPEEEKGNLLYWIILAGAGVMAVAVITLFLVRWVKQRKTPEIANEVPPKTPSETTVQKQEPGYTKKESTTRSSSIFIFGGFQVIDKNGEDITSSFTPLLKELFLYIMLNSLTHNKGVSPKKLYEVFWFDKSEQSARNNRAVNIAKLKMLLSQVGDCKISKETGYWKFTFNNEEVYIDYHHFLHLMQQPPPLQKALMKDLLKIIKDGPLLSNINAEWLDEFKAETSNDVIDRILSYIRQHEQTDDPESLIHLANAIFYFDLVNEEAMIIKCQLLVKLGKHSLARNAFTRFEKEYQTLYGENYSNNFQQVLQMNIKE